MIITVHRKWIAGSVSLFMAVSESYSVSPKMVTIKEGVIILRVESSESSTGSSPSSIASSVNISIASSDSSTIQLFPPPTPPQPKTSTINIAISVSESSTLTQQIPLGKYSIVTLKISETEETGIQAKEPINIQSQQQVETLTMAYSSFGGNFFLVYPRPLLYRILLPYIALLDGSTCISRRITDAVLLG